MHTDALDPDSKARLLRSQLAHRRRVAFRILQEDITPLEEQIRALQQRVLARKHAQNQISSISTLPDEVLSEIFTYLVYDGPGTDRQSSDWVKGVTHICSRWRQVALQCPRLWNSPSFASLGCTTEMIKRAKSTPISFVINLDAPNTVEDYDIYHQRSIAVALKTLPAAKHLVIYDNRPESGQLWDIYDRRKLESLGPNGKNVQLESVSIFGSRCVSDETLPDIFNHLGGPDSQLRCVRLRCWSIFQVRRMLELNSLSPITELEITFLENDSMTINHQSSVEWVIICLKALPKLKSLTLRNVFLLPGQSPYVEESTDQAKVENQGRFPELDQLVLTDYPHLCRTFLMQLPHSPKKLLDIECRWDDNAEPPEEEYKDLLSEIIRLIQEPMKFLKVTDVLIGDRTAQMVYLETPAGGIMPHADTDRPRITMAIVPPVSPTSKSFFLQKTIHLLPLDKIEFLIYESSLSHPGIWNTAAEKLKALSIMWISTNHWDFVRMLSERWDEGEGSGARFSALQYLHIDYAIFEEADLLQVNTRSSACSWATFLAIVQRRFELTNNFLSIHFGDCMGLGGGDLIRLGGASVPDFALCRGGLVSVESWC